MVPSVLRLDVDGALPQRAASGTIPFGDGFRPDWVAFLKEEPGGGWTGEIERVLAPPFPYTSVRIRVTGELPASRRAEVVFSAPGRPDISVAHRFQSESFRQLEIEYDTADGAKVVRAIDPTAHPIHAPDLPSGHLSIEQVYQRVGFRVRKARETGILQVTGAGANEAWSDQELHDAMLIHWSQHDDRPQWSLWVLFAARHERQTRYGMMFDYLGPQHRQGVAIFSDYLFDEYENDPSSGAQVARLLFCTAVHEIGHAFNLRHPGERSHERRWLLLRDDDQARTFMNIPRQVNGGSKAFFNDFEYRFSDEELLFLRHAPERLVQPGDAAWLTNLEFPVPSWSLSPHFRLILRANRPEPVFDFLEPVVLELKLLNISKKPQQVLSDLLEHQDELTVVVRKDGTATRVQLPFSHYCDVRTSEGLEPKQAMYASLFVSAGPEGWVLAEPGQYTVQVALEIDGQAVVSNPYDLTIQRPLAPHHEQLAQDYFTLPVARVLAFDGSRAPVLKSANEVLRTVADQAAGTRAAIHAQVALGVPGTRPYRTLEPSSASFRSAPVGSDSDEMQRLQRALATPDAELVLGHIDYRFYADQLTDGHERTGKLDRAAAVQQEMKERFRRRGVLQSVVDEIAGREARLRSRRLAG